MLKRILTAVCALCLFIPVLYFSDSAVFPIAMAALAFVAVYEMLNCIGVKKIYPLSIPSYILALSPLIPFVSASSNNANAVQVIGAILFLYLVYLLSVAVFSKGAVKFEHAAVTFTTIFYVVISFCSIVALRYTAYGKYVYLLTFIGPWISDTFAYFCGRLFGKHKLIPDISPKKTIEGSVGGMLFTAIAFVVYGLIIDKFITFSISVSYIEMALIGIIVSVISQIGDLTASLIKRTYGIKDYGFFFPGHGGVLDRFDSVLLTAPVLLIMFSLLYGGNILL